MKIPIYQVDAFTSDVFKGNPAAVCPLKEWLPENMMLKIAAENNLSETAFFVREADKIEIRWFTPKVEVNLCGHATLASAFVLHHYEGYSHDSIPFHSRWSGDLPVQVEEDLFKLNFPADHFVPVELNDDLLSATNKKPVAAFKGKSDYMLLFESQKDVDNLEPDLALITRLKARGLIVTAIGNDSDFVSRFFGPGVGVDEDPVCGSAHTTLTPYWTEHLKKNELLAIQRSARGGELHCRLLGDRVELGGKAVLYMKGQISI